MQDFKAYAIAILVLSSMALFSILTLLVIIASSGKGKKSEIPGVNLRTVPLNGTMKLERKEVRNAGNIDSVESAL